MKSIAISESLPGGEKYLGGTYSEALVKPLWYFTGTL